MKGRELTAAGARWEGQRGASKEPRDTGQTKVTKEQKHHFQTLSYMFQAQK